MNVDRKRHIEAVGYCSQMLPELGRIHADTRAQPRYAAFLKDYLSAANWQTQQGCHCEDAGGEIAQETQGKDSRKRILRPRTI
jgi:hypothetical protein